MNIQAQDSAPGCRKLSPTPLLGLALHKLHHSCLFQYKVELLGGTSILHGRSQNFHPSDPTLPDQLEKVFGFFFFVLFWFLFPFLKEKQGREIPLSSLGVSKSLIQLSPPATVPENRLNEGSRGKTLNLQLQKRGKGADRKRAVSLSNQYFTKKSVQSQGTLLSRGCCRRQKQGPRWPV